MSKWSTFLFRLQSSRPPAQTSKFNYPSQQEKKLENQMKIKRLSQQSSGEYDWKQALQRGQLLLRRRTNDNQATESSNKIVERDHKICSGAFLSFPIRGFQGPLSHTQMLALMSKMYHIHQFGQSSLFNNSEDSYDDYVYYLCDDGRVLDLVTNRRFFRLQCNSSSLQPQMLVHNWPNCYSPTHCIGDPLLR